jgi:hypothetical protein
MPLIIDSYGKAKRVKPIQFLPAPAHLLSKLYEELMQISKLDKATGEALDKMSKTLGIVRKDAAPYSTRNSNTTR